MLGAAELDKLEVEAELNEQGEARLDGLEVAVELGGVELGETEVEVQLDELDVAELDKLEVEAEPDG